MDLRAIPWFSLLISASLLVVALGLYRPALEHGFVHFDDPRYVTENRAIQHGMDAALIEWAFSTDRMGTWHPLTWLSHAADWSLYGSNPRGHHLTSLLLHALNVLLLFGVLRRMTDSLWASAFVALVFAAHPLNVESVAWIASRKGVLSTTFWLLTIWAYVRYTGRRSLGRYLLVVAAFALGLFSKPMVVSLPLVLLLLDVWPLGRMTWSGRATGKARPMLEKVPLLGMAMASGIVVFAVRRVGEPVPWTERLAHVPIAYVAYLKRIFWPAGLATPYPQAPPPNASGVVIAGLLLLAITAVVIWARKERPFLIVGWLWFLVTLAPVIGVVQIGAQPMADRWTYVPMIGVLIAIAWGVASLAPDSRAIRALSGALAAVVIVGLGAVTHAQIRAWESTETLFRRAIEVTDGNRTAHYNLAWDLARQKRTDEAIEHYRRAIEIDPDHFPSQHNLALLLLAQGRREEAVEPICAALRLADPSNEALRARLTEHLAGAPCP
jgi:hypothetical protein